MATTILPFVIRPKARGSSRPRADSAKIIIFPGVRYETGRADEELEKPKRKDGPSRGRKTKAR